MVDLTSFTTAISGLKTAGDIAKSMLDLRDAAAQQGKVIELQSVILNAQTAAMAAQSQQLELVVQVRELKDKLAAVQDWERQKDRYFLKDFGGETFAYVLKKDAANGEPSHRICVKCYQHGKRSILQSEGTLPTGREKLTCSECAAETSLGHGRSNFYD